MEIVYRRGEVSAPQEKAKKPLRVPAAEKRYNNKQYIHMLAMEHLIKHNLKFDRDAANKR